MVDREGSDGTGGTEKSIASYAGVGASYTLSAYDIRPADGGLRSRMSRSGCAYAAPEPCPSGRVLASAFITASTRRPDGPGWLRRLPLLGGDGSDGMSGGDGGGMFANECAS